MSFDLSVNREFEKVVTEQHAINHFEKSFVDLGKKMLRRGHSLWKFNIQEGKMYKLDLEFDKRYNVETGRSTSKCGVKVEPYCLYETALNAENAAKKFQKMMNNIVNGKAL